MGCIYDDPLDSYICDADWNCVECPNWIDESEANDSQAEVRDEHMSNIEVVIKIPEDIYKDIMAHNREMREGGKSAYYFEGLIQNGTLLPKGHGDLKDADVLDRDLENAQVNLGDALSEAFDDGLTWASEVVSKSSTIIEADAAQESGE